MATYSAHYSVLKEEILDLFKEAGTDTASKNYADLTFGAGGHSLAILNEIEDSYLHCFDQDTDAYHNGLELIKQNKLEERVSFHFSNFSQFANLVGEETKFAGILLDAGVSSHQFDTPKRGFSFRYDAPLDMRMSQSSDLTAEIILNTYSQSDLEKILFEYGEEKFAKVIVKNILAKREEAPLRTTKELEDICFHSYPKKLRFNHIHPATKTFQALRIEVNSELDVLSDVIGQLLPYLDLGGVIAIISFHSLEDRIVKRSFKQMLDGDLPIKILTKKPIIPTEREIFENSRSRSAKLRVVKRVEMWPTKNKYPRQ